MLGAISLNRIGFGLVLIVAFSLGLAGVLTAIGIVLVHARHYVGRIPEGGRVVRLVPVGSAIFITLAGAIITFEALANAGLHPSLRGGSTKTHRLRAHSPAHHDFNQKSFRFVATQRQFSSTQGRYT